MSLKTSLFDEPSWSDRFWLEIILTILCAIVGVIGGLFLFGVL